MLDDKQQSKKLSGITASDGVVILQLIARLVATGNVRDNELATVGNTRSKLVESIEKATEVNFDQVRAAQEAALRRAQQQAQANASQQKAAAAESTEGDEAEAVESNGAAAG